MAEESGGYVRAESETSPVAPEADASSDAASDEASEESQSDQPEEAGLLHVASVRDVGARSREMMVSKMMWTKRLASRTRCMALLASVVRTRSYD